MKMYIVSYLWESWVWFSALLWPRAVLKTLGTDRWKTICLLFFLKFPFFSIWKKWDREEAHYEIMTQTWQSLQFKMTQNVFYWPCIGKSNCAQKEVQLIWIRVWNSYVVFLWLRLIRTFTTARCTVERKVECASSYSSDVRTSKNYH